MITLLTIFHVLVCIFLIFVVLLQQSSGADWAGAFGGGGSQTTFGARGSTTVLGKATTIAAVLFMITSLALAILVSRPGAPPLFVRVRHSRLNHSFLVSSRRRLQCRVHKFPLNRLRRKRNNLSKSVRRKFRHAQAPLWQAV
jgi:preprotein translocase subunit SecG